MNIQFTGHNIEATPALRDYVTKKFNRLEKFDDHIIGIHVTFTVDKLIQIAEAHIKLNHSEIHARSDANDMYAAIDEMSDKVFKQVIKYKEKHDNHRE